MTMAPMTALLVSALDDHGSTLSSTVDASPRSRRQPARRAEPVRNVIPWRYGLVLLHLSRWALHLRGRQQQEAGGFSASNVDK